MRKDNCYDIRCCPRIPMRGVQDLIGRISRLVLFAFIASRLSGRPVSLICMVFPVAVFIIGVPSLSELNISKSLYYNSKDGNLCHEYIFLGDDEANMTS